MGLKACVFPAKGMALIPAIGVRGRLQSLWRDLLESGHVKILAGKADSLSSVPRTHVKKERTGSQKLSPGVHTRCGKPHPAAHHTK